MGSFGGHVLPGTFFFVFGFWWTFQTYRRYFRTRKLGTFRCTPTTKCDCLCGRVRKYEVEGLLKVVFVVVGIGGEVIHIADCENFCLGNSHHITMFFAFGLTGVIDLLVHHKCPLPDGVQYISNILALIVEAVLFKFHLHDRSQMDILLHTFLLYVIYLCIVVVAIEMWLPRQPLCMLARCFAAMLQGTWFWQVGFILYPPGAPESTWNQNDPEQMMLITLMFAWHMIGIVLFILIVGLVMACVYCVREKKGFSIGYEPIMLENLVGTDSALSNYEHQSQKQEEHEISDLETQMPVSRNGLKK